MLCFLESLLPIDWKLVLANDVLRLKCVNTIIASQGLYYDSSST